MDAADAAAGVAGPGAATAVPVAARRGWRDPRVRKVVQVVLSAALVVGIFWYVLQQFADLSEVWAAIQTLTWLEVAWLVVAAAWNLFTYWVLTVIATPGLRYPQAVVLTENIRSYYDILGRFEAPHSPGFELFIKTVSRPQAQPVPVVSR